MREITVKFEGESFVLKESELGFDLNQLRKAIVISCDNPETHICGSTFKNLRGMNEWTRVLSEDAKEFYEFTVVRGGTLRGATFTNEQGVYAYSEWLNEKFGFAVINAFTAAVRGDDDEAVRIAQEVAGIRDMWRVDHPEVCDVIVKNTALYRMRDDINVSNVLRLVCKSVFGIQPSTFEAEYGMRPRQWIETKADSGKAREYNEALTAVKVMCRFNKTYDEMREFLIPEKEEPLPWNL